MPVRRRKSWIGHRQRLAIISLTLVLIGGASPSGVSIHTRDSLSLHVGTYSSILFAAEPARAPDTNLPLIYRLTASGETPPGMKFEAYPCNKPGIVVCPQAATVNGIFLDGTPSEAGSYTFVISATGNDARTATREFTVVVNARERAE